MCEVVPYSSDSNNNFFEGVEKLLEIWFTASKNNRIFGNIRDIPRKEWENILKYVRCTILDEIHGDEQTAYLLSESSMFISDRRIILKTCGTTLCLQALPHIIKLVKEQCGFDVVADCFYSRKNFMKPDNQPHPHKTFQDEIVYLDKILSASASYCLGRIDGDCWFLYTLNHAENKKLVGINQPDQTIEILMTELDRSVMSQFSLVDEGGKIRTCESVTKTSGIAEIIPGSKLSTFLFDPCGYSLNGLLPKGGYWTIHVTPEEEFSYVSFESNIELKDYSSLIRKVVEVFKPGKFSMTLFANHESSASYNSWYSLKQPEVKGFSLMDKQVAHLQDYCLFYTNYKENN